MSIFSILTLLYIIFLLRKAKILINKQCIHLICIIVIQFFFIFRDGFDLFGNNNIFGSLGSRLALYTFIGLVVLAILATKIITKLNRYYKVRPFLFAFILIGIIYSEYFNGIYSFSSLSEFQRYNLPLKKYCYLIPYKLVQRDIIDYQIEFPMYYQGEVYMYYNHLMYGTEIKYDKGELLYYVSNGWGEDGHWFQFGVPRGQQI